MTTDERHKQELKTQQVVGRQSQPLSNLDRDYMHHKTSLKSSKKLPLLTVSLLSLMFGLVGGAISWLALDAFVSDDQPNQRVVLKESELISNIAQELGPSVVSITVQSTGVQSLLLDQQSSGEGTGIIVSEDGLIMTNSHVIGDNTSGFTVFLSDGTSYDDVEVLGKDSFRDIAFLKINDAKDLEVAKLGDSSNVKVGDKVVAIGNALGEYDNTVTAGIISGLGRPVVASDASGDTSSLSNLLQTDTAINPGNSGGPLVNINGEVIGINTAVARAENIGFAIPINDIKSLLESVRKTGELVRPYLGVRYVAITEAIAGAESLPVKEGALIIGGRSEPATIEGSPADKAGVQDGDIITKINNHSINQSNTLVYLIGEYEVGDNVVLTIIRDDDTITLNVELEAAPSSN